MKGALSSALPFIFLKYLD